MQKVAILEDNDCIKIMELNAKKDTLNELFMTLTKSNLPEDEVDSMYKRLCSDMEKTKKETIIWWQYAIQKYSLIPQANCQWHIDYSTRNVFLLPPKKIENE